MDVAALRESLARDGGTICQHLADHAAVQVLRDAVMNLRRDDVSAVRERRGQVFAIRNLAAMVPEVNRFASSGPVRALISDLLETDSPVLVRSILFDKPSESNWRVPWHQDTTIAVRERLDTPGYGPWSVKAGVVHVRPPAAVLAAMITVRLHLDDADDTNGALKILPGSHRDGLLEPDDVYARIDSTKPMLCAGAAGDALLMKPLVLHASAKSTAVDRSRRVIHLEYAGVNLPNGLAWCESG